MNPPAPPNPNPGDLPLFEPTLDAIYTLDVVAELTGVSSQTVLHYQEQGLISAGQSAASGDPRYNDEALRTVRRIEYLRSECELNGPALRLTLRLLDEIERLRAELRARP